MGAGKTNAGTLGNTNALVGNKPELIVVTGSLYSQLPDSNIPTFIPIPGLTQILAAAFQNDSFPNLWLRLAPKIDFQTLGARCGQNAWAPNSGYYPDFYIDTLHQFSDVIINGNQVKFMSCREDHDEEFVKSRAIYTVVGVNNTEAKLKKATGLHSALYPGGNTLTVNGLGFTPYVVAVRFKTPSGGNVGGCVSAKNNNSETVFSTFGKDDDYWMLTEAGTTPFTTFRGGFTLTHLNLATITQYPLEWDAFGY